MEAIFRRVERNFGKIFATFRWVERNHWRQFAIRKLCLRQILLVRGEHGEISHILGATNHGKESNNRNVAIYRAGKTEHQSTCPVQHFDVKFHHKVKMYWVKNEVAFAFGSPFDIEQVFPSLGDLSQTFSWLSATNRTRCSHSNYKIKRTMFWCINYNLIWNRGQICKRSSPRNSGVLPTLMCKTIQAFQ